MTFALRFGEVNRSRMLDALELAFGMHTRIGLRAAGRCAPRLRRLGKTTSARTASSTAETPYALGPVRLRSSPATGPGRVGTVTPSEFAAKWAGSTRTERAAAQEHFIDLCRMLGHPTPNQADPTGEWYAFEKGAEKTEGSDGFADVWKKGHFAWEYKGKRKDLAAAYKQLLDYREALENPPLLVVCDLDRFEVHTNFTGTAKEVHRFTLADLAAEPKEPLRVLRAVMGDPEALRPAKTRQELTEEAAKQFADLALALDKRGHDPQAVAHFLDKLLFCLFAEDAGLLPKNLIGRLADSMRTRPEDFANQLSGLFTLMARQGGGFFGPERIEWFNGNLFDSGDVVPLRPAEIDVLRTVARLDWSEIEPAIFGTLFERGLDPDRRSQLGAHYTDRDSIARLVEPVLMAPLRREFEATKSEIGQLTFGGVSIHRLTPQKRRAVEQRLNSFLDRVRNVIVLDPACGSGNFLYIALQSLKDLEREAMIWASTELRMPMQFPQVGPHQLRGLEINAYAAELTRVTIWIGQIQWMLRNGFGYERDPILRPLNNIETRDALIDWSDPENPTEADWPDADAIIGNPPFLGGKLMRAGLTDDYVNTLFRAFEGRVPREADFVTYWHEKARAMVAAGRSKRVGMLATQGIRGGANRRVVEKIKQTGDLFLAWSDQPWVLEGANVHISFLGYDDGTDTERVLDGRPVDVINANLTAGVDLTKARRLPENMGIAFMGDTKGGPFDIPAEVAYPMLDAHNPDGRSNRAVLRRWVNGLDITRRPRNMWIVDFGTHMVREEAALYAAPYEYVETTVKPERLENKREAYAERWWLHVEPRSGMRAALSGLDRYIATTRVAKHRLFVWLPADVLADSSLITFARDDDYTFGVLHSRAHELWALRMGTQLETRPRYTPTTTFETFPFPKPTQEQQEAIAAAARRLNELREGWLNPPGASDEELEMRTLTNLYNDMPAWLRDAHAALDDAVLDAYGWPVDISDNDVLARLLTLNLERAGGVSPTPLDDRVEDHLAEVST
jgi:type II restriction/modification system DNA methylase subunit YeeA